MTITFPWGSLLRGVLGHDDAVLDGITRLLAPGAPVRVLASVIARDGVPAASTDLPAIYTAHGLELTAYRPAAQDEIQASGSSWAKRLRAGGPARPVTLISARRDAALSDRYASAV